MPNNNSITQLYTQNCVQLFCELCYPTSVSICTYFLYIFKPFLSIFFHNYYPPYSKQCKCWIPDDFFQRREPLFIPTISSPGQWPPYLLQFNLVYGNPVLREGIVLVRPSQSHCNSVSLFFFSIFFTAQCTVTLAQNLFGIQLICYQKPHYTLLKSPLAENHLVITRWYSRLALIHLRRADKKKIYFSLNVISLNPTS